MKYDVMFIGPASKDENIDYTGKKVVEFGGAAFYGEYAARAMGGNVFVALKMNPADREIAQAFDLDEEHIRILPSSVTTTMRNTYFTADRERRVTEALSQAETITPDEIPDLDCSVYHIAGLLYGDFDNSLFPMLSQRGKVGADMQCFLRHNEGGKAVFHDWAYKKWFMKYIDYLKVDANEAQILTGTSDRRQAAKILHDMGAKEVFVSHNTEMLVYDGAYTCTCPVKSRNLSGRTGRGDTVFGAYLTARSKGEPIDKALLYATAVVSMKMEQPGPLRATKEDIRRYILEMYE